MNRKNKRRRRRKSHSDSVRERESRKIKIKNLTLKDQKFQICSFCKNLKNKINFPLYQITLIQVNKIDGDKRRGDVEAWS